MHRSFRSIRLAAVLCVPALLLAACGTAAPDGAPEVSSSAEAAPAPAPGPSAPTAPVAVDASPAPQPSPLPATPSASAPAAAEAPVHVVGAVPVSAQFGSGKGPSFEGGVWHLLDDADTRGQSNAIAWDRVNDGARAGFRFRCAMRVLAGGDGGAFVFLDTGEHGIRGPAPHVRSWTQPNVRGAFAVGIDVHEPKSEEPFGHDGNILGLPERLVSLHWDGRELVKRVAAAEFRGEFTDVLIAVTHVCGGAEVTVRIGSETVFDREFVAGLHPYEMRLAVGAGTRADVATRFDVKDVRLEADAPARRMRPPVHVEVFDHVRTDNSKTAFEATAELPPAGWAFGRVILNLDLHDAGQMWDEWDRCGEVSVFDAAGTKLGIVPFITSYRTPCHWKVDVTHFRPLLAGKTRFEIAAGTNFYKNRGYLMSVSLDFHHGTPELEPFRVIPLWNGTANHGPAENHFRDFFAPRTAAIDAGTKAARVFMTTTGHSQVGEFTPADRTVTFRAVAGSATTAGSATDAGVKFDHRLWKTDCWLNPNRPQFGTWKYPRAGWAPGDIVRPWWIDLTPHAKPGATAEFLYEPKPYDFSGEEKAPSAGDVAQASHNVRSYLILWRTPDALRAAPTLRIMDVVGDGRAAKAGIRAGDWLVSYDGRPVDSLDDLRAGIAAAEAASKPDVPVVVFRAGEPAEFRLPPGRLGVSLSGQ